MEHKNNSQVDQKKAEKKATVRYKECLKNHAASLGGNATDGCGEFMASGEDDSLKCSACNCHRNFHRKENLDSEHYVLSVIPEPLLAHLSPNHKSGSISPSDNSDDQNIKCEEYGSRKVKKRFRTKFTQEQKEKMLCFAEKAGWKIQKLDESTVQRFCQEVGIKRRVLKVWMHNNKNTFANKNNLSN